MAEQEIRRLARVARAHGPTQLVHVLHEHVFAACKRQVTPLFRRTHALAVPHVIVRAHHVAVRSKEPREIVIAAYMLGHAVNYLDDAFRRRCRRPRLRTLRRPYKPFDLGFSVMRLKPYGCARNLYGHMRSFTLPPLTATLPHYSRNRRKRT